MQATTLTVDETAKLFRDRGISCAEATLRQLIIEGKLPFAVGTQLQGKRKFIVSKAGCIAWLDRYYPITKG